MNLAPVPPIGSPRWLIPRAPLAAMAGLRVYQPMTLRGRVVWDVARFVARAGIFGVFPRRSDPETVMAVQHLLGDGWSVAVSMAANRRRVALVIDDRGSPIYAVKIADDEAGQRGLADEAQRMRRLAPHLAAPLSAPRIIDHRPGLLVLEAVPWQPRWRPWRLPVSLARGIGRFHRADAGSVLGPGHGDFAPWNVMRTVNGWSLIDWEDASKSASPYGDPFHFLVQAHALLGRPQTDEILAGLRGKGWVGLALQAYADAAALSTVDRAAAFADYLRASMPAEGSARADHVRGRQARQTLLARLGRTGG